MSVFEDTHSVRSRGSDWVEVANVHPITHTERKILRNNRVKVTFFIVKVDCFFWFRR